jgi:hypothetical protein
LLAGHLSKSQELEFLNNQVETLFQDPARFGAHLEINLKSNLIARYFKFAWFAFLKPATFDKTPRLAMMSALGLRPSTGGYGPSHRGGTTA